MAYKVLDVSRYNPIEDYSAAAGDIDGVLIRCGYRGYGSSGSLNTDNLFTTHYNGFNGKGCKIGFYWFTQAISEAEGIEEANYVHSLLQGKTNDFPVYIDSEYSNTNHTGRADSLSASARTDYLIAFCDRMIELGYRAGVYASDSWYASNLELSRIQAKGYSLWVARYSSNPPANVPSYDGWQYTSDGTIAGYSGRVDLSHFYTDVAGWDGEPAPTGTDISTLNFTLEHTEVNYYGGPNQPEVTVKDAAGNTLVYTIDYDKEYQDNTNAGTAKVIVTGKGNFYGSKTLHFTINPLDITPGASIELDGPDSDGCYSLDNIVVSCMGLPMVKDRDYTLSVEEYEEDGYVKAKITATAIEGSNFTGYYYERYPIEKLPTTIDISNFTITLSGDSFAYTGEEIKPFTGLLDADGTAVDSSEYDVSYQNNINAGNATVKVTAKDINYTGTISTQFTITALSIQDAEVTCGNYDVEGCYNLENLKVTYNDTILEENTDYEKEVSNTTEDGYTIANITITGINNYKDSVQVSYKIEKLQIDINTLEVVLDMDFDECVYTGTAYEPDVLISDPDQEATVLQKDEDYTVEYSGDTTNVGTVTVIVKGINDYNGTKELQYSIVEASISEAVVDCGDPDENACYNLENLTVTLGDKSLQKDQDYEVETSEEQSGVYINTTVVVSGINNYKDSVTEIFRTAKVKIDLSGYIATILDDVSDLYYTGEAYTPEVYVEELQKDTDYEVEYQDNINAGTAKILITGINDYEGSITLEFEIQKVTLDEESTIHQIVVTCGEMNEQECYDINNLQVTVDERVLEKGTDYTVTSFDTDKEEDYEVLTTVTINGKNNYDGSIVKVYKTAVIDPFVIDINSLEITIDASDEDPFVYSGEQFKPEVTIMDEDEKLFLGEDYEVVYRNNINAGTGFADITGINKYRGNKTMMFAIIAYDFSETVEVTCGEPDENGYYDLENLEVKLGDKILSDVDDYSIEILEEEQEEYIKNTVEVSGKNNYSGTKTIIINSAKDELFSPIVLGTCDITLDQSTFIFTGQAFEPKVQIKYEDEILVETEDYSLEYEDNINAGEAKVIATAVGDRCTGSIEATFTIEPKDLSSGAITCGAADEDGCYDIKNLTVRVDEVELQRNIDYSYQITTERVDYTIISTIHVTGKDNYKGELTESFKTSNIVIDVNDVDITLSQTEFVYTSELIRPDIITDLELDEDYEVEYQDSINYGTYVVTITGKNHYTGERELEYQILRRSVEDAEVTCGEASSEGIYDINNLSVSVDGRVLTPSVDYQFTTQEQEGEDGFHQTICHIYGINNYTDSIEKTFTTSRDQIYPGKKVELELCTVYPRFGSRKSSTTKTGTFYLWDNKVVNNRIRLTNNPDGIGKPGYMTGWVDLENVITRTDLRIGDKVLVNGTLSAYADGSGNTLKKTNIFMYIVDILDAESFSHNYGLASDVNRVRQGWATLDMIERIDE